MWTGVRGNKRGVRGNGRGVNARITERIRGNGKGGTFFEREWKRGVHWPERESEGGYTFRQLEVPIYPSLCFVDVGVG